MVSEQARRCRAAERESSREWARGLQKGSSDHGYQQRERKNWGCNSGGEHLPSMAEVLGLILQEKKKKKKYKRNLKTSDKKKESI